MDYRPQSQGAVPMRGEAGFRPLMLGNPSAAQPGYVSRYEFRHQQQNDPFGGKGNPMSDGGLAQPQGGMGLAGLANQHLGRIDMGMQPSGGGLMRLMSGYGPMNYR